MDSEKEKILEEIGSIKYSLDTSHDMDPDYLVPHLRELRSYIFQVHASYEKSLELVMQRDYLKSKPPASELALLFERLTFRDKQLIASSANPAFPNSLTTKLNVLRNSFAHKKGREMTNIYRDIRKTLKVYRLLSQANDALNNFWLEELNKMQESTNSEQ